MSDDHTPDEADAFLAEASEAEIAALQAETAALKEQLLRYAAEAENTKRRAEREANDARAYAIQKFARDLLEVSDNLSRALKAEGLSAMRYAYSLRLEHARQLLANVPQLMIREVADQCGFLNAAHFSRVFKEHHGMTPREFALRSASQRAAVERGRGQGARRAERSDGHRGQGPSPHSTLAKGRLLANCRVVPDTLSLCTSLLPRRLSMNPRFRAISTALAAAVLFGAATPLAKKRPLSTTVFLGKSITR